MLPLLRCLLQNPWHCCLLLPPLLASLALYLAALKQGPLCQSRAFFRRACRRAASFSYQRGRPFSKQNSERSDAANESVASRSDWRKRLYFLPPQYPFHRVARKGPGPRTHFSSFPLKGELSSFIAASCCPGGYKWWPQALCLFDTLLTATWIPTRYLTATMDAGTKRFLLMYRLGKFSAGLGEAGVTDLVSLDELARGRPEALDDMGMTDGDKVAPPAAPHPSCQVR